MFSQKKKENIQNIQPTNPTYSFPTIHNWSNQQPLSSAISACAFQRGGLSRAIRELPERLPQEGWQLDSGKACGNI